MTGMSVRDASIAMGMDEIAPRVWGYTMDVEGALYIPLITAEIEGNGDVGRYLDGLPRDRDIHVPCCLSARLRDMLIRRGFVASPQDGDEAHMFRRAVRVRDLMGALRASLEANRGTSENGNG